MMEPECSENNEQKKKRERKRKVKKIVASSSNCVNEDIDASSDDLDNGKMEKSKVKMKRTRRRTRTKKNPVADLVDGEGVKFSSCSTASVTIDLLKKLSIQSHNSNCDQINDKTAKPKKHKMKSKTSIATNHVTENGVEKEAKFKFTPRVKTMHFSSKSFGADDKKADKRKRKENAEQEEEKRAVGKKFCEYLPFEEVYTGIESRELFCGDLRINPKDYKVGYVTNPNKEEQDVLIESIGDRNGALEGDKVVVQLKDESEWKSSIQKVGTVVYIIEKNHPRTAIGSLKLMVDKNKRFACFHPRDSRVPRIKIPFTDWPPSFFDRAEEYEGALFLGKILKWTEPRFAVGTILEQVGQCGQIQSETRAILAENDLDCAPLGEEYRRYFPKSGTIHEVEYKKRVDLRKECIFTIDPLTARDLDDAVSCKELPNGNLEIGVHISDVCYYLDEGTPLDKVVAQRATSIYMVESVYHMLPKELCMMCSLLPGEDKLAFSVFWEMTFPEGKVVTHRFARTVINSCTQLAYEHTQMMIEDPKGTFGEDELPEIHHGFTGADLSRTVNQLHQIALNLRTSRFESGALRIDQPKIMFRLEPETLRPLSYSLYENKDAHRLIEEFMLLANITVATRLRNDYPDIAFLRSHPAPHTHMMHNLKSTLEKVGIHLDVSSAGGMQQSLHKYSGNDFLTRARMLVLNILCAKPMTRAHYFCADNSTDAEDHWHYALSVPLYTHFTSPIRRYADVMAHRQLAGCLGYTERVKWTPEKVMEIAANCNKKKYNAKRAGEQSVDLYLICYVEQNQPITEKAVVMDVKDNSFDAILIENGYTVRIYLNNLEEGVSHQFICEEEDESDEGRKLMNLVLIWPGKDGKLRTRQIIAMFSIISVTLSKKDKVLKLDAKLNRPDDG